ncbi:MAG TPA: efflux RND transporter periplasmic adaptor subunit [Candidatus Kapabacteria bacterium]|nr:efflux RND transporter periplasmic adaptor subunit [Candidatus Kapabacteria bacterium]
MQKKVKYALLSAIALVVVAFILYKIFTAKPPAAKKQPAPPVVIAKPERMDIKYTLEYNGDVLPILQANVFSRVAGLIDELYTDMGKTVRPGQLIALIDTSAAYQAEMQSAATYYNAKATEVRERELASKNLVSQQELDNAVAALHSAQAAYEANRVLLDYAKIRAPFHGVVTKRWLDPGSVVTSNPIVGNSNSTIFTIMDLDTVKIDVNVLDKDIAKIPSVQRATATVDVIPGREFRAIVSRSAQAVTTTTRTMPVEILIPNKDEAIKPGEFARVTLVLGENPNAITVPPETVLHDNAGTYVYIVQDSVAKRRPVQTGVTENGRLEITSGLDGTENVIVVGQTFARPNGKVMIVKNPSPADTSHTDTTSSSTDTNNRSY